MVAAAEAFGVSGGGPIAEAALDAAVNAAEGRRQTWLARKGYGRRYASRRGAYVRGLIEG